MVSKPINIRIPGPMPHSVTIIFENHEAIKSEGQKNVVNNRRRWSTSTASARHSEEVRKQCINLRNQGKTVREVERLTGVGKSSVLRWHDADCQQRQMATPTPPHLEANERVKKKHSSQVDRKVKIKDAGKKLISGRFEVLIDTD